MRRFPTTGLAAACALAVAAPAGARQPADYPAALDHETLAGWLVSRTNIAPDQVVSVTEELVVAIVGHTDPANAGGPVRLTLREEVIDPGYVGAVGGRSSLMSMEIQCEARRVRMEERSLYPGLNLTGPAEVTPPSAAWVRIPEGSIMDEVAHAACRPDFDWPLRLAAAPPPIMLAQAEPPPPPPVIVPDAAAAAEEPVPVSEPPVAIVEPPAEPVVEAEPQAIEEPAPEPVAEPPATPPPPPPPSVAEEGSVSDAAEAPPPAAAPEGLFHAIQIGAYRSEARARLAWEALSAERPVLVEGLRFETRPITVDGRRLLRGLVRDFASPEQADAFCTALAGTGYGCIRRTLKD